MRQTQTALKGFRAYKTAHFDIWYEPGEDAVLMPYLGDALEKAYANYGEELGVRPTQRIRVELFSDPVRFHPFIHALEARHRREGARSGYASSTR